MKISRCIRSGRVQSGKYGFLVFLRRKFFLQMFFNLRLFEFCIFLC